MLVAKIRIKTAEGVIEAGQPVKGLLSNAEIKELRADGYVDDDTVVDEPKKTSRVTVKRTRTQPGNPKAKGEESNEDEATGDGDPGTGQLPDGLNPNLIN